MTFSKKIFLSVFVTALVLGSLILWTSRRYVSQQTEEKFISRYSVLAKVLSDTLTRLDIHTEKLMLNAVKVISERDKAKGLLSTKALQDMRDELNVTHIFVVDKKGNFVRSTNEDPRLIPNAYSFCPEYEHMITKNVDIAATPIVHPKPEPKPYKFLFVPNHNRERLLEVGVRIDFIAKTLTEALGSDPNVAAMTLYDPHGNIFGQFIGENVDFKVGTVTLPSEFPKVVDAGNAYHFFTKVESSHPRCCQCDVSQTSKDGEYYYILEAKVSKDELKAVLASTNSKFLMFGLANLLLSLVLARVISRRLVRKLEKAAKKVRDIQNSEETNGRVALKGNDEVAYLTEEFDRLLDKLENSNKKLVEAEKIQAKVQLAREVAHNIKSPVTALEMMLPLLSFAPSKLQNVLKNSISEIRGLTDRLRSQADSLAQKNSDDEKIKLIYLPSFMESFVACKSQEFANQDVDITFRNISQSKTIFIQCSTLELRCILSNLVNNAIESYVRGVKRVDIELNTDSANAIITVRDFGAGIPEQYLSVLGKEEVTFKGGCERGLGLVHAKKTVISWHGDMKIESELGKGTTVTLSLPRYSEVNKYPGDDLDLRIPTQLID